MKKIDITIESPDDGDAMDALDKALTAVASGQSTEVNLEFDLESPAYSIAVMIKRKPKAHDGGEGEGK